MFRNKKEQRGKQRSDNETNEDQLVVLEIHQYRHNVVQKCLNELHQSPTMPQTTSMAFTKRRRVSTVGNLKDGADNRLKDLRCKAILHSLARSCCSKKVADRTTPRDCIPAGNGIGHPDSGGVRRCRCNTIWDGLFDVGEHKSGLQIIDRSAEARRVC
jgi:hypothetical protein